MENVNKQRQNFISPSELEYAWQYSYYGDISFTRALRAKICDLFTSGIFAWLPLKVEN